jgi:protocatechuate 3,4-dioxygenase alpha subunit
MTELEPTPALTPSQTIGPYHHFALPYDGGETLVHGPDVEGELITIEGRILDGKGNPFGDGLIEIWQANAGGRYDHPDDMRTEIPLSKGFDGFGRVITDKDGRYRFFTIKPGPVPGPGNTLQAPHVLMNIFARGLLDRLVTRVYFDDEPGNADDPVLGLVPDERRDTLIARRHENKGRVHYVRDIVLQGDGETVFFQV